MTLITKLLKAIGFLLFGWLVFVVFIATPALNLAAPRLVKQLGLELEHGIFLIDPVRFRLTGEAIRVLDGNGAQRISVEEFELDLNAWQSLRSQTLDINRALFDALQWQAPDDSDGLSDTEYASRTSPLFTWTRFAIEQLVVDPDAQVVSVGAVTLSMPRLRAALLNDELNLDELWAGLAPTQESSANNAENAADSDWSLQLRQLSLKNGDLHVATDQLASGALSVDAANLSVADVAWPGGGVGEATLEARLFEETRITAAGDLLWADGSGTGRLNVSQFPLTELQPIRANYADGTLDAGRFSTSVEVSIEGLAPSAINADASIEGLVVSPPDHDERATAIEHIRIAGVAVAVPAQTLSIENITLSGVETLLHIERGGSINLLRLMKESAGPKEEGQQAEPDAEAELPGNPDAETTGWQMAIGSTRVENSTLDFRDDNLPVQFTARIEQLNGELSGFDSALDSTATWQATGVIEGYAPVTIDGVIGHFSDPRNAEFHFATRGVDLATLAPYSATYAGFPIERGVMELSLDYVMVERGVEGGNELVIEQLELGERQKSDRQVVNLPLKTAVALLSDAAGVIDISLPVSGSLDDPEFHIWGAAARAAMTLITNAVTAPFRFLASLIGSSESLDHIPFNPGESQLSEAAQQTLADLTQALNERPAIRIAVDPGIDPVGDGAALARQALKQALHNLGLDQTAIDARGEAWQAALISLGSDASLDVASMAPDALLDALLNHYRPGDEVLLPLANERAANIKKHLVEAGGVDPQRIAVSPWRESESPKESAAQLSLSGG